MEPANEAAPLVAAEHVFAAETAGSPLQWHPAFAGIARSGDLGFTTGPYFLRGRGYTGHYFTMWRREASGEWKWIFDGGVNVLDDAPAAAGAPVSQLPLAAHDGAGAQAALEAVRELDAALAVASTTNVASAITARLANDARVQRAAQPHTRAGGSCTTRSCHRPERAA